MKRRSLPLSARMRTDATLKEICAFSARFQSIKPHQWVRDLRKRLHMSQRQLAKRAKITQSRLSQVESGKAKITLETLEKILGALFCDLLILPFPQQDLERILKEQAYKAAQKKLSSLSGSMSLEDQLPSQEYLNRKILEVAEDFLRSGSKEIWD